MSPTVSSHSRALSSSLLLEGAGRALGAVSSLCVRLLLTQQDQLKEETPPLTSELSGKEGGQTCPPC